MSTFDPSEHPDDSTPARTRPWLMLAIGAVALAGAVWLFWPAAPAPDTTVRNEAPAPPPAATPAPNVEEPAPPKEEPRAPRPRPRPAPAPEEAPAPEPVEEKAPEGGSVRIESDVPGTSVFIDRKFVGTAPVTAEGITPGTHQLNASAEGHEGIARSIDVVPGENDVVLRFLEVRLAESIDVVHKKAFGSTPGKLVASPDGLRFVTQNPKDGFEAKLTDLQEFEVDYLKKNLKVKLRNGKTFNFTDKQETADALFVFHRNVDKVRSKVGGG